MSDQEINLNTGRIITVLVTICLALSCLTLPPKLFAQARSAQGYGQQKPARAQIASMLGLFRNKQYSHVVHAANSLLKTRISNREKAEIYQLLALSERHLKHHNRERHAWMEFYNLTHSSDALLRVVHLLHRGNHRQEALKIANRVQIERLSDKGKIKWYKEIGNIYFDNRQYRNSAYLRHRLSELNSTGENWFDYAQTLVTLGELESAQAAINRAIAIAPGNHTYQLNKALIVQAMGEKENAMQTIKHLAGTNKDFELHSKNGFAALDAGNAELAVAHFQTALDKLEVSRKPDELNRHLIDLGQLSIQSEIRKIKSPFKVEVQDAVCRDDDGCQSPGLLASNEAARGQGYAGASYQFNDHLSASAGVRFENEANAFSPDSDRHYGSAGIHYAPFTKHNLRLSLERQFAFNSNLEDYTKASLQAAHTIDKASKPSATNRRSWPHTHLYLELAKHIEDKSKHNGFIFTEGRYGRTIKLNDASILTPFLFSRGQYLNHENIKARKSIDAGLGMSLRFSQFYDKHEGYRTNSEIFFRAGRDLYLNEDDKEFRTEFGVSFNYQ